MRSARRALVPLTAVLLFALVSLVRAQTSVLVLQGGTVYPISGPPIPDGVLVVSGGKIIAVGPAGRVNIPAGATVRNVAGKIVMPGIIDTHSHIGIDPNPTVSGSGEANEGSGPIQSELRAIDGIDPADPNIRIATAGGITTVNIMPGSGNVMGGQTAYLKLRGQTVEQMLIPGTIGGMKMANGDNPKHYGAHDKAPTTRMEEAALARGIYWKALQYQAKWDAYTRAAARGDKSTKIPDHDLALDPVVQILQRNRIVHNHTHRADDIMTAIRLADEFHYRLVIHHGTESCLVAGEIAARHLGVSFTMLDAPGGKYETINFDLACPGKLEQAGVKVAFNTDDPITNSRLLMRSAALAVRNGMSEGAALKGLTIYAAEMLDLDKRIGSLDPNKDADFIVLSGPPFSVYTRVLETWIEGQKVFDRSDPHDLRYSTGGFAVAGEYPAIPAPATAGGASQ